MQPLLDADTLQGFRDEVESYLPAIRAALEDESQAAEACRLAQSIQGAASLVGMAALASVADTTRRSFERLDLPEPDRALDRVTAVEKLEESIAEHFGAASAAAVETVRDEPPAAAGGRSRVPLDPREIWVSDLEEVAADLLATFQSEAEELLGSIGDALRGLRRQPGDRSLTEPLRRHVHTLKGAAGMVGLRNAGKLAHRLEDCLDRLHSANSALNEETLELLQSGADLLEELCIPGPRTSQLRDRTLAVHQAVAELVGSQLERSAEANQDEQGTAIVTSEAGGAEEAAGAAPRAASRMPVKRIDELLRLSGEITGNQASLESAQASALREVDQIRTAARRLQQLAERLETRQAEVRPAGRKPQSTVPASTNPAHSEFDELELDRYTELGLLARDLSELAASIAGAGSRIRSVGADLVQGIKQLGRLNAEAQDRLMQLRMAPLSSLRRRLERTVRVTASASGKQVEFEMEGDVSLDKSVLDALVGPLEHLLRNAVDHGIEDAELRVERGKPAHGVIRLRAWLEGVQAVIDLTDDGGGFDLERLRRKAVAAGLLDPAAAVQATPEQLHRFAFHPGLSTATQLSETSGRGVGLDAVRSSILALSGAVRVRSAPGEGTTFSLRLPTTLAAARLLLVRAAEQTFALPLYAITRVLRASVAEVQAAGDKLVLAAGGERLPLVYLNEALGLPSGAVEDEFPALLIEAGDQRYALAVERLLESRDAVIKSLGPLLRSVRALSGATVLGDGSVCLVLNPAQLTEAKRGEPQGPPSPVAQRPLQVLVVDDSISARTAAAGVLEAQGWSALTARDGLEALEALESLPQLPDAVLLDVEMPRMDGYELLTALRSLPRFENLPVVMLTSRAGDKHRAHAFALGADDYLIKPFEPEALLSALAAAALMRDGGAR